MEKYHQSNKMTMRILLLFVLFAQIKSAHVLFKNLSFPEFPAPNHLLECLKHNACNAFFDSPSSKFIKTFIAYLKIQNQQPSDFLTPQYDFLRRTYQINPRLFEEFINMALIIYQPMLDLNSILPDLAGLEVYLNSETMGRAFLLLPPNSQPKLRVFLRTADRPLWLLHACFDLSDPTKSCLRIKLRLEVNDKPFYAYVYLEFYFRNTINYTRPIITNVFVVDSNDRYDKKYIDINEFIDFANKTLFLAKGALNFLIYEKIENALDYLRIICKSFRISQTEMSYNFNLDLH